MSTKLCLRRLARWKWNALHTALSLAATTAAIQNSVQKLAATTRLGVKKKTYQN